MSLITRSVGGGPTSMSMGGAPAGSGSTMATQGWSATDGRAGTVVDVVDVGPDAVVVELSVVRIRMPSTTEATITTTMRIPTSFLVRSVSRETWASTYSQSGSSPVPPSWPPPVPPAMPSCSSSAGASSDGSSMSLLTLFLLPCRRTGGNLAAHLAVDWSGPSALAETEVVAVRGRALLPELPAPPRCLATIEVGDDVGLRRVHDLLGIGEDSDDLLRCVVGLGFDLRRLQRTGLEAGGVGAELELRAVLGAPRLGFWRQGEGAEPGDFSVVVLA